MPVSAIAVYIDNISVDGSTPTPTAAFTYSSTTGSNAPITITFTDTSSGATSWDWDFGDGTAHSTLQNPTHTFSIGGAYDVVLSINSGADTETHTLTIYGFQNQSTGAYENGYKKASEFLLNNAQYSTRVKVLGETINQSWGISDNSWPADTTSHGVYFTYSSGTNVISLIARNESTTTVDNHSLTLTEGDWVNLNIHVDDSGVATYYVNGALLGTISTNVVTDTPMGIVHYVAFGSSETREAAATSTEGSNPYAEEEIIVSIMGTVGETIETLYPDPTSITVERNTNTAYWSATVIIKGHYDLPASTDLPVITITVPDHESANQTIFYGVVVDTRHVQQASGDITTLTCYDFGWYLSCQMVPIRSTITAWASESGPTYATPDVIIKEMLGNSPDATGWANVTGINPYNIDTNAAWGDPITWHALINEAAGYDTDDTSFAFDNAGGTLSGTSTIWIGTECLTTSSTSTPLTVTRAQGGTAAVAHLNNALIIKLNATITAPEKAFQWTPQTNKFRAIMDVSEYTDFIFYAYWKSLTGEWTPAAYWIAADDIDTDMDLPAQVTIPIADPNLIGQITSVNQDEEQVNLVTIWGAINSDTNLRFYKTVEAAEVTANTKKPIEYVEVDDKYDSQSAVEDRAEVVLTYMSLSGDTYTATLKKRTDLRLYQLLMFTDADDIPEEDMRITGIKYEIKTLDNIRVIVNFTSDRKFTALRKLKKVSQPSLWSEINELVSQQIMHQFAADLVSIEEYESGTGVALDSFGDHVPVTGPT